jgi:hypothetical protein
VLRVANCVRILHDTPVHIPPTTHMFCISLTVSSAFSSLCLFIYAFFLSYYVLESD